MQQFVGVPYCCHSPHVKSPGKVFARALDLGTNFSKLAWIANKKHNVLRYLMLLLSFPLLTCMTVGPAVKPAVAKKADARIAPISQANNKKKSLKAELEHSYHEAWRLVRDNTLFPDRLKNWKRWEHKYDGKLNTGEDLENAVTAMLEEVSDQYTYFRNDDQTETVHTKDEQKGVVSYSRGPRNIGVISISSFSSCNTADELENALKNLQDVDGLVLDLRGNKGGYVEQAVEVYELLTDEGKFVSMKGRQDGKPYLEEIVLEKNGTRRTINGKSEFESRRANLAGKKPLIVLVDSNTRSAAEMLAGALRETNRARLAGCKTFGKGVVQNTWDLEPSCSIRITMARYYLPDGKCINGSGITPDINISFQQTASKEQPQAFKASRSKGKLAGSGTGISSVETILPDLIPNLM